jgi:hypothetical protein
MIDIPLSSPGVSLRQSGVTPWNAVRQIGKEFARFRKRRSREQWFLAYQFGPAGSPPSEPGAGFQQLVPPRDRFWADPFPLATEGHHFLFFEELLHSTQKGRIVVSEFAAGGGWSRPRVALERPYHLSYPFVFAWCGQWFMVPETGDNRTIELWRCREFPCRWTLDSILLGGVHARDSTLAQIDGRWWMFTCIDRPGGACNSELHLFHAKSPRGPWRPHALNPIVADASHARPAGNLFQQDGRWFRPAQDCSVSYGRRMSIREIETLNPQEYREREVRAFEPEWTAGLTGTHTWNTAGSLAVIDGCRLRWCWAW